MSDEQVKPPEQTLPEVNAVAVSEEAAAAVPSEPLTASPPSEDKKTTDDQSQLDATKIESEKTSESEMFLDQLLQQLDEIDEENIDKFLQLQDPEFAEKMQNMKADKELSLGHIEVDDETAALHDEIERWRTSKGIKKFFYIIMPFLPRLNLMQLRLRARFFAWFRVMRIRLVTKVKHLLTDGRKSLQKKIKQSLADFSKGLAYFLKNLKALSLKLKLAFAGLILLFAASVTVLWATFKGYFFHLGDEELFLKDLSAFAVHEFEVTKDADFENFYDNSRSTPNLLLIQKMVVNIKSTAQSTKNPMFAVEFFVEGLNPDVIIEVKDREAFFRDLIQRTIEDFSYDQLSDNEGRQLLVQALLREMNRNLTTGELRNIRFKTIVVKP